MSLLLEALKKAEKAKEEAQRQAGGEALSGGLEMEPAEPSRHITTRNELPDIAQPMEITSDDIGSGTQQAREASQPARRPQEPEERSRSARATAAQPQEQPAERAAAKKVFEAKFKEPNPKLPFYIAMGVLGALAVGTVIYFWMELRPPPPLVNPNPPKSEAGPVVAVPDAKPVTQAPQAPPPAPQIPGLPDARPVPSPTAVAAPAPAPAPAPSAAPAPATATAAAKPAASPRATAAPRQSGPAPETTPRQARGPVAVRRAAPAIDPQVSGAYEAYNAGNLAAARSGYERALATDPSSRDALLGLAAVEMRSQNFSAADALYQKLLRADPRDAHAQAGMLALRSQSVDPVAGESRVKSLLANDPESGVLHFTLANQYAQQGRWAEAQQSYFKAHASEPDNPDFAYNLAVSLDRLRQRKLAADYYRRALDLAAQRSAAFDAAAASARLQELSR